MSKIVSPDAENIKLAAIKFQVNHGYFAILTEVVRLHWPTVEDEMADKVLLYKYPHFSKSAGCDTLQSNIADITQCCSQLSFSLL